MNIGDILLNKEDLQNFRKEVDASQVSYGAALEFYNTAVKKSIDSISNVSLISHDFKLSQILSSYVSLIKAKEFAGIERAMLSHTFSSDIFTAQDFSAFNTYNTLFDSNIENFQNSTQEDIKIEFDKILKRWKSKKHKRLTRIKINRKKMEKGGEKIKITSKKRRGKKRKVH